MEKANFENNFINIIKLLIYQKEKALLEKINFEDDCVFLNPLLFAYFNSKENNFESVSLLEEIVQGYFTHKEVIKVQYSYNKNNIAYLPNLGYYKNGIKIDEILIIDEFEILKETHPLIENYFTEYYRGHIINANPKHKSAWKDHHQELEKSILIVKIHLPDFYNELVFANKKIYLHDNPKILNFTTIETLGLLYFYVLNNNNTIYFIEELIHQGSHNYLYHVMSNLKDYFKIDARYTIMRDLTLKEWDYRDVFGAFHGLYTVTRRVECFDILLSKNVFSDQKKHELLGRFADQFARFRTGLELLDLNQVYTQKGLELYHELDLRCYKILEKYSELPSFFDLSNRDLDFRYEDFCKLNSYDDFKTKEAQGLYNF
ncbi:hypothetical protein [Flavobacterium tructae]|uniref:hypothetical protein n=1 Tax=Flavobacterium tructae TaxID=1114873 RepID=UPI0035A8CE4C